MTKSRFSFWNIYLLYSLLLSVNALGIYFLFHPELEFKGKMGIKSSGTTLGIVLIVLSALCIYWIAKWTIQVVIKDSIIELKGIGKHIIIQKHEIVKMELIGRESIWFLIFTSMTSAIIIEVIDGKIYILPDCFYRQIHLLKMDLQNFYSGVNDKPSRSITKNKRLLDSDKPFTERFSGNFLLSVNGVLISGISLACLYMLANNNKKNQQLIYFFIAMFFSLFYFVFGRQSHYFYLSEDTLIIKNHLFFWKQKTIPLIDIKKIVIETPHQQSTGIRVIMNDFRSTLYSGGSLRGKTWQQLIERLKKVGIKVENESFI